jgi:hypothetical protein
MVNLNWMKSGYGIKWANGAPWSGNNGPRSGQTWYLTLLGNRGISGSGRGSVGLVLGHLLGQPFGLFAHVVVSPGLAVVVVDSREAGPSGQLLGEIRVIAIHHGIDGIGAALVVEVGLLAGDDVDMDMRDALAGVGAVLDGNVKRRGAEDALDHAGDALDGQEEVVDLCSGQVVEAGHDATGRYEDMAGQEGLEIDYGEGQAGAVEDLGVPVSCLTGCSSTADDVAPGG